MSDDLEIFCMFFMGWLHNFVCAFDRFCLFFILFFLAGILLSLFVTFSSGRSLLRFWGGCLMFL